MHWPSIIKKSKQSPCLSRDAYNFSFKPNFLPTSGMFKQVTIPPMYIHNMHSSQWHCQHQHHLISMSSSTSSHLIVVIHINIISYQYHHQHQHHLISILSSKSQAIVFHIHTYKFMPEFTFLRSSNNTNLIQHEHTICSGKKYRIIYKNVKKI